ncbi:unnamed protein product [Ostreobium quekettii]|uniref:Photolyase/cryptochrome alpha/beta domain-containing protein n=1 Tax=Ostreobium quekettii TaxID=121088 RepID=A0A8S1J194_9CHLO|nr:unnamed protein product [Ostreobium quekettii]|eukprot:evm.model.scf_1281EXC.4 EVM.evm.TU.scf_1281EXC.4   scf_1281EXC:12116-14260(-)
MSAFGRPPVGCSNTKLQQPTMLVKAGSPTTRAPCSAPQRCPPLGALKEESLAHRGRGSALSAMPPTMEAVQPANGSSGCVLVWFKNDLRLDDHPGLFEAASAGAAVVPFYCVDPKVAGQLRRIPGGVELLWGALDCLRRGLRELGSDLVIRVGDAQGAVRALAVECGATVVAAHDDVEESLASLIGYVGDGLQDEGVRLQLWKAPIWEDESYVDDFAEFQKGRGMALEPLPRPSALPEVSPAIESGDLPDVTELRRLLDAPTSSVVQQAVNKGFDPLARDCSPLWLQFAAELTSSPDSALQAIREYLVGQQRGGPTNGKSTLQELIAYVREPRLGGVCFSAIFSSTMLLGLVSPRLVHKEACDVAGTSYLPMGLFGANETSLNVLREVEMTDFHAQAARMSYSSFSNGYSLGLGVRYWRWKSGHLMEYVVAEPDDATDDTPAILLVHGFGASSFHWRRNIGPLRDAGYRVFCPTLPGYGRSEKPSMRYSQEVWSEYVKDFIVEVVGQPVVLGGNSIGGYMSASVAGQNPSLVHGLILFNSAGPVDPTYSPEKGGSAPPRNPPPKIVVDAVANGLLWYLQTTAGRTLKSLYPTNPQNVDAALEYDIMRAGTAPNALSVLKSVFFLKPPPPLNYVVRDLYGGPVLVLQGVLDPLNDAGDRAAKLDSSCPNVEVKLLQAGHCPHDEVPDEVNDEILQFVGKLSIDKPRQAAVEEAVV